MTRLQAFEGLKDHAWLKRVYAKLSTSELKMAHEFIKNNDALNVNDFQIAAGRMFVNLGHGRPKNWAAIEELLSCANSSLRK